MLMLLLRKGNRQAAGAYELAVRGAAGQWIKCAVATTIHLGFPWLTIAVNRRQMGVNLPSVTTDERRMNEESLPLRGLFYSLAVL